MLRYLAFGLAVVSAIMVLFVLNWSDSAEACGHQAADCGSTPVAEKQAAPPANEMVEQYELIRNGFESLEEHFRRMMSIGDVRLLKREMKRHEKMLAELRALIREHKELCRHVPSTPDQNEQKDSPDEPERESSSNTHGGSHEH